MEKEKNKKVIIGVSGGIDSSVAAVLLKRADFDVIGVFMKLDKLKSSRKREKRAKAVAKKLNISFQVLDLREEFEKKVIKPFIKECKKGRTPNPCVTCNKEIKFKFLFKKLLELKADFIATGHYARIRKGKLLEGKDKNKDQSYFLCQMTPKLLNKILFPVGGYTKREVKQLAKDFELPFRDVSDSQEICFIQTTINDFFKKHLGVKPGKIIDPNKKVIGKHQGLWFYTIGQRKGIKLSGGPYYVLNKDIKKNYLVVTRNEKDLYKKELIAKNLNWIINKTPGSLLKVKAKIRYGHKLASAILVKRKSGGIKVTFSQSQRAITPGQSVVFYKGEEVLGGGVIQ